jgi:hypothetical protein
MMKECNKSKCSRQIDVWRDKKDKKFSFFLIEYLMFFNFTMLSMIEV